MGKEMPKLPQKDAVNKLCKDNACDLHPAFVMVSGALAYQSLRADAWEARARLAVETLIAARAYIDDDWSGITDALAAIGPLPEVPHD